MFLYILNILSIFAWRLILDSVRPKEKQTKLIVGIVVIQMIFISGLRGMTVGTDVMTYSYIFQNASKFPFSTLVNYYIEPGYMLWNRLIFIVFGSYQAFLFANIVLTLMGVTYYINKNSENPIFSLLLFIAIGYYNSSMNIMRQYLALAIVLVAYSLYVKNKKLICPLLLAVIASTFHITAIAIVPVIIMHKVLYGGCFRREKLLRIFTFVIASLVVLNIDAILPWVFQFVKWDYSYSINAGAYDTELLSPSFFVKIICSVGYLIVVKKCNPTEERKAQLSFLNYINLVSCAISIVAANISLLSRLNLYFSIVSIVFLPNLFVHVKCDKWVKAALYVLVVAIYVIPLPGLDTVPWVPFFIR